MLQGKTRSLKLSEMSVRIPAMPDWRKRTNISKKVGNQGQARRLRKTPSIFTAVSAYQQYRAGHDKDEERIT
jgi:hypothetical protein